MKINKEIKKAEAINRLKAMEIIPEAIRQFDEDDIVNVSENPYGILFWADDEQKELIEEFEKEYNALVYHVIHTYTEFGELYNFLYVSDHNEEWICDHDDLEEGYAYAYVWNKTDEWCSEIGSIGVRGKFGGIVRTAQKGEC